MAAASRSDNTFRRVSSRQDVPQSRRFRKPLPVTAAALRHIEPADVAELANTELLGLGRSLKERYAAGELTGADIPLILAVTREEEARLSVSVGGAS